MADASSLTPVLSATRSMLTGRPDVAAVALSAGPLAALAALTYGLSVRSLRRLLAGT